MTASDPLRLLQRKLRLGRGAGAGYARERLCHVALASLVSIGMALILLLSPVDWNLWKFEGHLSGREASGRIGYVRVDPKVSASDHPQSRLALARKLDALRVRGVERVFINVPLDESRDPQADAVLVRAMRAWGSRLTIVDTIIVEGNNQRIAEEIAPLFADGHPRVLEQGSRSWPGHVWELPYSYETAKGPVTEFGAALAGIGDGRQGHYPVNYGFRDDGPIEISEARLAAPQDSKAAGRPLPPTVVIGTTRGANSAELNIPGKQSADPSFVAIYGAETLLYGPLVFVPGWMVTALIAAFLAMAAMIESRSRRFVGYAATLALPAYFFGSSVIGTLRLELSYCLVLLPLYAFLRSRGNWRHRLATTDPDTGLPTLRACLHQLSSGAATSGFVAVAKIHGYETILRSFNRTQRTGYVMKLVERLRITDPDLTVYVDGHYLGWIVEDMDEVALRGHFEGLRAIFAAPVAVDEQSVDVGITFGAAEIRAGVAEGALGAALEALEQTDEALEPIRFATKHVDDDTLWDLSLRGRIDAAMEAGEVFCVYQPKYDIVTNTIVGVEALVRWQDPERGFIPPIHFVMQCEKAGRMEYLTRYVLQSACSAGRLLNFRGHDLTMAVNISATLLTDMRIVGIVRNVLQATEFDPARLVLEITETARIRDFDQARLVLSALRSLGARIAMDDFGVGAANFEAFQALPVDEIKIDRQFVAAAGRDQKSKAVVASLLRLGRDSRIAVVAEGAETDADVRLLREIGCRHVQGFALAKPMPLTNLLTSMSGEKDLPVNG